jgi:mRNA interferase RelE/StbE
LDYEIRIIRSAEKEIDRLPSNVHDRLSTGILLLGNNPRPRGVKKLSGRAEYRLRVGDYRILYIIDDRKHIVTVVAVGHRREVYG